MPPLAQLAADLWLLARARGQPQAEEARAILMRSVSAGADRRAQTRWLLGEEGRGAGPARGPTIMPSAPPPDIARDIPMCPGSQARGEDGRDRPSHAYAAVEDAKFRLAIERLGSTGLLALDACFNASPFGPFCQGPLREAQSSSRADIEAGLIATGSARRERGRACWCEIGPCSWERGQSRG